MTIADLKTILASTGLPVAYLKFPADDEQDLPVICFRETGTNNFAADDKVFQKISDFDIELYTTFKSPATEALVEQALADASIVWEKTEEYLDTEKCYEIIYEIEVLIDG